MLDALLSYSSFLVRLPNQVVRVRHDLPSNRLSGTNAIDSASMIDWACYSRHALS